jgi:hypothetical protein
MGLARYTWSAVSGAKTEHGRQLREHLLVRCLTDMAGTAGGWRWPSRHKRLRPGLEEHFPIQRLPPRFLSHLAKNRTASTAAIQLAMELFGAFHGRLRLGAPAP